MFKLETINELTLKVTCDGQGTLFTRTGAFIGGEVLGGKNYKFEKLLLGPQEGFMNALVGSLKRRVTGENIPLMKMTCTGPSTTYFANAAQHVTIINLGVGEKLSVESENLLAFTEDCNYDIRFLGQGILSQKGIATTVLTGKSSNSQVAILTNGNPIQISNETNGNTLSGDPDAVVCWSGADPQVTADVNWKTFIG